MHGPALKRIERVFERLRRHDSMTSVHCARVGMYAQAFAKALGWPPEDVERCRIAGRYHDVGKLAVPLEVLHRPSALTLEELDMMGRHSLEGAALCRDCGLDDHVVRGVEEHHERWDGRGYHRGLAGEAISPIARIVALANAYDVMRSGRPYRPALEPMAIAEQLYAGGDEQWDGRFVAQFVALMIKNGKSKANPMDS